MKTYFLICSIGLSLLILTACNISTPDVNPSPEILISEIPTLSVSPSATASLTPSVTPTQLVIDIPVVVSSPLPTQDDLAPTFNTTPTETPGPCEVTVQSGETLIMAANRNLCGNQMTNGLIASIVSFNDNINNADFVSEGLIFLVPRPSPTPVPEGADLTATVAAEQGICAECVGLGGRFPANQEFGCHTVVDGDSIIDIAEQYDTTLELLSPLNPALGWGGCDFTNPSGGPSCNPPISIGQCVEVPFPTSTPIPTTTPSGNETATPTPTHEPARVISPPEGAIATQRITLEWVSVGILNTNEVYLITIEDRTSGTSTSYQTRNTRYVLPDSLIPSDGQAHSMAWRVIVARQNNDSTFTPVGGAGAWNTFQWQSR